MSSRRTFLLRASALSSAVFALSIGANADAPVAPPVLQFAYTLPEPSLTSAAVYDSKGILVRNLWSMQKSNAGSNTAGWDGKDNVGVTEPSGRYRYEVAVIGNRYANVGAIGNSAIASRHTPTNLEDVAVDPAGAVYTANNWDETGADFKKWNAAGIPVYEAQYQIRNGNPNGAPYSITTDDKYIYVGVYGWPHDPWNDKQQIQRFTLSDGKAAPWPDSAGPNGHIQIMEWPENQIPAGTPDGDKWLMTAPLRGIAVSGSTILITDGLDGKILKFDKTDGHPMGSFPCPLPRSIAVDSSGNIWVGHSHHIVEAFSPAGTSLGQAITDIGEVQGMTFGPDGKLYVCDSVAGQVKIYQIDGAKATLKRTFGHKAVAGDYAADRYFTLRSIAVDSAGNMFTIQVEPVGGAHLAKFSPSGVTLWQLTATEFVSLGNYNATAPDDLFSVTLHHYKLLDRSAGTWRYLGPCVDKRPQYGGDPHGVPRLLTISGRRYVFLSAGDGVQVYRIDSSGAAHLAALVGGSDPGSDGTNDKQAKGEWSWSDVDGTGEVKQADIKWFQQPGKAWYNVFGMNIDAKGDIWFANLGLGIWMIPTGKPDAKGNPTYDWAQAKCVIPKDGSALAFDPTNVVHADDGSIYAFGWSKPWPSPQGNGFWMGGTTLVRYARDGSFLWALPLPAVCTGLDSVPNGGGVMVGAGGNAHVYHYTPDGQLVAEMQPGKPMGGASGAMDDHASLAVNRDPRDGKLDIFTEDDYGLRIGWYRASDGHIRNIEGVIVIP